jgi:hypothetical protein
VAFLGATGMKRLFVAATILAAASTCGFAQQWEFGGFGGGGFLSNVNVSASGGSAKTGFEPGIAAGAFVGQYLNPHWSGEIRYEFRQNNLYVESGGQKATFSGYAHMVHYDLILHTNRKESRAQFFAALGGGMKMFQGTGASRDYQPLSNFALLTHTQQMKPMASVGGGVRFTLSKRMFLRAEFRDFITTFPTQVITPPGSGVKYPTLLHDIVPLVGISYEF